MPREPRTPPPVPAGVNAPQPRGTIQPKRAGSGPAGRAGPAAAAPVPAGRALRGAVPGRPPARPHAGSMPGRPGLPRPALVQPAQNPQQQYNPMQQVNGAWYWVPQGYNLSRYWHEGFEVWAMAYPAMFPDGKVWHYNLTDNIGTQFHVYINAYGAYEIVPPGGRPGGY